MEDKKIEIKQDEKQTNPNKDILDLALKTDGAEKGYEIVLHSQFLTIDEEVNKRLKVAGFTNEQAQLVYDLAAEIMIPKIREVVNEFKLYKELSKLENYFGGEERFDEIARQISLWADKNLPAEIYQSLNTSFYGVIALYNMMTSGEPKVMAKSGEVADVITEEKLKEMMKDPKYWRDNDKNFIKKVDDGFKFLYGDE
ncbi:MAG: hypothetical protein K6F04_03455 [bacterium]|nr:hypothetical protein [bacterium]